MNLFFSSDHMSHGSSSEQSPYSSEPDSSDSSHSESFEESSYSDVSLENDEMQEEQRADGSSDDCIIVSSDEESMQMEAPITPLAPLTPGAELDPGLPNWSGPFHVEEDTEDSHCQQATCQLDSVGAVQSRDCQEYPPALSLAGFPGCVLKILCCRN